MEKKEKIISVDFDTYKTKVPENSQLPVDTNLDNPYQITAPIPGVITKIFVKEKENISSGTVIMILEAMKMRNRIYSKIEGEIKKIYVKEGERVVKNQKLCEIE